MSESGYSSDESNAEIFYKEEMNRFRKNYEVESLLMKSANGCLYNALCKTTNREVVAKIIPKKARNMTWLEDGSRVPMEVKMHMIAAAADNDGTVGLLDVYQRKKNVVIILEKPQNSIDLLEFVKAYGALSYATAVRVVRQLARSSLLHRQAGVLHRDLKDENVLFDPVTGACKIVDFGCATLSYDDYVPAFVGTDAYSPPEFTGCAATERVNADAVTAYQIGCITFVMITGTNPFEDGVAFDFQRHVQLSPDLSKQERTLLASLLCPDPIRRVSLSELI